jgi:uncharacterized protein YndB with AHSA1/START domain
MAKTIHQEVTFKTSPEKVYAALTEADQFSKVTGAPAKIATDAGGPVELFGGQIAARNVELVPGKRLVQAWRAGNWEEGVYSVVRFELKKDGAGTKLVFDHAGYPEEAHDMLEGGWHQMYWNPLTKYFS